MNESSDGLRYKMNNKNDISGFKLTKDMPILDVFAVILAFASLAVTLLIALGFIKMREHHIKYHHTDIVEEPSFFAGVGTNGTTNVENNNNIDNFNSGINNNVKIVKHYHYIITQQG